MANRYFFVTFPFAVLGSIPNYTVWLESLLRVEFNSSKNCSLYLLFRQGTNPKVIDQPNITSGDNINFITFTIPSVSILFNNVTMTVQAEDSIGRPACQQFFIYTHGCLMLPSTVLVYNYVLLFLYF